MLILLFQRCVKTLTKCLNGGLSGKGIKIIDETIILNDLILVFLRRSKKAISIVGFVPDEDIFHRVSEQSSFDTGMVAQRSMVVVKLWFNVFWKSGGNHT